MHAILNIETGKLLTSFQGKSVWDTWQQANDVKNEEFGGEPHLEVVLVQRTEE